MAADPAALERLGRHLLVGYRDASTLQALIQRRSIAGIYLTARNVEGKTSGAIRQSTDALQALMAAACKAYAAQVEAGEQVLPLPQRGGATATEVMITASGLLKAANLAVFELGMWQAWSGRQAGG